jgi:YcxB-like protein
MYTLTYQKPMMTFLSIVGFLMFIMSFLYFLDYEIPFNKPPYFQILFGLFIIAVLPFTIYRNAKKNFSTHGILQETIIYEFTDDKIKMIGESFNSEMDWTKIHKIVELKNWILIYQNRQIANVIPKESFGDNLSGFKLLAKSKGIETKFK